MSSSKQNTRVAGSILNKVVASELQTERDNCNFDQKELSDYFYAQDEQEMFAQEVKNMAENPGYENTHKFYEYTPEEVQQSWVKKLAIHKKLHSTPTVNGAFCDYEGKTITWNNVHQGESPLGLHQTMFYKCMERFTTPEQKAKWVPLTLQYDIHGCYAQTEIGHGSDVAGLMTTATYDVKLDQFIIHTPEPKATKWWPGELGRWANHAVVFAQIIIPDDDGDLNNYGVAPFIVQLRSLKDHKHMPGVKTGDMGPKLGYTGKDNGWATFDHVRIPRDQMLQKFVQVDREGTFSIEGDLREMYAVMMFIRNGLVSKTKTFIGKSLLIGLRYSVVRRQFKNISGQKEETQIIDYQTQQMKLFPILATLFAHIFTSRKIYQMFQNLVDEIAKGEFQNIDLLHHLTSAGKSVYTQDCYDSMITIRQSLGGAGYSAWSGIPYLIDNYSPDVTYEGDNTVMAQQSFNYLRKLIKKVQNGQKIKDQGYFDYLNDIKELTKMTCTGRDHVFFMSLENIHTVLKVNLAVKIERISKLIQENTASKKDFTNILHATDIVQVSQEHFRYLTFWNFKEKVTSNSIKCKNLEGHLTNLCILYGLQLLQLDTSACYESGYFAGGKPFSTFIDEAVKITLKEIRPYAISLIESSGIPDEFIMSAIGNSYGDIYETHLRWAKDSKLNHTQLGDAIPDGYMQNVMPLRGKM